MDGELLNAHKRYLKEMEASKDKTRMRFENFLLDKMTNMDYSNLKRKVLERTSKGETSQYLFYVPRKCKVLGFFKLKWKTDEDDLQVTLNKLKFTEMLAKKFGTEKVSFFIKEQIVVDETGFDVYGYDIYLKWIIEVL